MNLFTPPIIRWDAYHPYGLCIEFSVWAYHEFSPNYFFGREELLPQVVKLRPEFERSLQGQKMMPNVLQQGQNSGGNTIARGARLARKNFVSTKKNLVTIIARSRRMVLSIEFGINLCFFYLCFPYKLQYPTILDTLYNCNTKTANLSEQVMIVIMVFRLQTLSIWVYLVLNTDFFRCKSFHAFFHLFFSIIMYNPLIYNRLTLFS